MPRAPITYISCMSFVTTLPLTPGTVLFLMYQLIFELFAYSAFVKNFLQLSSPSLLKLGYKRPPNILLGAERILGVSHLSVAGIIKDS